jgi:hypothetical protein
VLAGLGWHLCRVWSTDWLRNRGAQVQRVLAAVERARTQAPAPRRMPPPAQEPAPPTAPRPQPARPQPKQRYRSIADVPESEIRRAVTEVLVQAGGTDPKDLTRSVAYRLGFERTGKNIEQRINGVIEGMVRAGALAASPDDGNVRVASVEG